MKNKTGLLFLMLLLLTINGFAQQSDRQAPEATAAEAKLSFWDIPKLKEAFIDAAPTNRQDGLSVGELGVDGGNKEMILKLAQEIADGKHGNFDSFLIAHKGKLLFESYYLRGRINLPHGQASATKSYTSLAVGRAIQMGYLSMDDLDKPLVSFLKDLDPSKFVEGAELITLHKAMSMQSGIRISKEQREAFEKDPSKLKGQKEVQAYLEHSAPITLASQSFLYQNDPMLVMQVLEAVVPGSAKDFIKKELLDKMGISNYIWGTDISGLPRSGNRTNMISRDMIKWGTLAMNKGKWNGEQLVPEAFIDKAINSIVHHSDNEHFADNGNVTNVGYGYYWWQADMKAGNKNYFSTSAQGGSGQNIILIEELDLIVVTTVHRLEISVMQMMADRILPAFIKNSPTMSGISDGLAPEATAAEAKISFWDMPHLKKAFIDIAPAKRNDGIAVGNLNVDSAHKDMIIKLAQDIGAGKHGDYDGLLIAHKDKLVFESYYKKGRINLSHGQASAVKAYTSMILGRAIQLGYLTMADLDKPLVSFLKDLDPSKFVDGAEKITLHKALTMHGGLSIDSDEWEEIEKDSARLKGQGLVQTLLEHSDPITSASQTYLYGNFNPMLVMTVIDAVVPGTAEAFIKNELLDKMGITNYQWANHASGLPQAGWMVSMTARDMLKWGSLVLNKGKWKGEQFISEEYLARATSGIVEPTQDWIPDTYRYGYFWYYTPITVGNKSYDATFAWGGGGQRVIVIAELDLTIVITGHDREDTIMTPISEIIVPAFIK